MNIVAFPLKYLVLKDERDRRLYRRDALFVLLFSTALAAPFILLEGNFFGVGGFLDRIGSFASVLTGFYIAALVGVASLSPTLGDLDKEIEVGAIYAKEKDAETGQPIALTRRQYVCTLFGYLAFASLFVSISSIVSTVLSGINTSSFIDFNTATSFGRFLTASFLFLKYGLIIFYVLIVCHIVTTTCHGLYYYIERIYAAETTIGSKADLEKVERSDPPGR
ncbi:hypothetical protein OIU34_26555 [Pararhizobium sp. BT-229]|uniref:hypothetical protein n=1 Tax=Pararhizobium sp. BT-229 TaxID=2986923 RepID=UPI0021F784AF|nr:hypothetical protein [Pararhizobium sp. BT-229]MCV9965444.1 hypothetical protein [Pararhizobium sp. BT-229]